VNDFYLFKFAHKIHTAEIPEGTPFLKLVNRNSNKIQLEMSFNAKIMNLYKRISLIDLRTKQQKTPLHFKRQTNNQTKVSFSKRGPLSLGMKNNNRNISVRGVPGTILYSSPEYFSIDLYLQY